MGRAVFDAGLNGCAAFPGHGAAPIERLVFAGCAEAGNDGLLESAAALQGFEDGKLFPFEAAEIDGIVDAMDGEIDGSGFKTSDRGNFFALLALLHGIAGDFRWRIASDGEQQIVDGIVEIEKANIGLQAETKFRGISSEKDRSRDRGLGGAVESFDFSPFEANHVDGELTAIASGVLAEPGLETRTEVAHGERARGAVAEIVLRDLVEAAIAEDRAKAGEIVGEGVEDAEPVLPIVDFEAFEGSKAIVGLDDFVGDSGERTAVGVDTAHAIGRCERGHDRVGDVALESGKIHTAAAREALAKYLLAFSASW